MADNQWLVIELSEQGESAGYAELENALTETVGSEYFIPVHHEKMGSYVSTSVLFEGYVFVRDSSNARTQLDDLRDSRYFSRVLENQGRPQTVDSRAIGVLKRKLKNSTKKKMKIGTKVKVLEGIFENLVGEVVGDEDGGKKVIVKISRLSRQMIAPLPATSVVEIS